MIEFSALIEALAHDLIYFFFNEFFFVSTLKSPPLQSLSRYEFADLKYPFNEIN